MPRNRLTPSSPDDNSIMLEDRDKPFTDILDWLSSIFGFQVASNLTAFFNFSISCTASFVHRIYSNLEWVLRGCRLALTHLSF